MKSNIKRIASIISALGLISSLSACSNPITATGMNSAPIFSDLESSDIETMQTSETAAEITTSTTSAAAETAARTTIPSTLSGTINNGTAASDNNLDTTVSAWPSEATSPTNLDYTKKDAVNIYNYMKQELSQRQYISLDESFNGSIQVEYDVDSTDNWRTVYYRNFNGTASRQPLNFGFHSTCTCNYKTTETYSDGNTIFTKNSEANINQSEDHGSDPINTALKELPDLNADQITSVYKKGENGMVLYITLTPEMLKEMETNMDCSIKSVKSTRLNLIVKQPKYDLYYWICTEGTADYKGTEYPFNYIGEITVKSIPIKTIKPSWVS